MKKKKNNKGGLVYSTAHSWLPEDDLPTEPETLPAEKQKLRVVSERKNRAGKVVTLVKGFVGKAEDLENLGKLLRNKCGTGGSVKNGEIIIQGNLGEEVKALLNSLGYAVS